MYIRGFEAQQAIEQDHEARWVRWTTMPHLKRPLQEETLRPGRQPPKEHLGDSLSDVKKYYSDNKKKKQDEEYWQGKGSEKPTQLEMELAQHVEEE